MEVKRQMIESVTAIVSVILTGVSSYMVWYMQNREKKKNVNEKAMKVLMRRELRELHDVHMAKGEIDTESLGEFEEIYEIYHQLGGNGIGTLWKEDVERLVRK